ncbi:hypothetical protein XENORESO_014423 [Xenotaenia resolanae]|uniref:Uncharacterized protein n=1 Tax=Xenotaenia resolanae TaxID=208358 RepID=A0ABV0WB50_9TELE
MERRNERKFRFMPGETATRIKMSHYWGSTWSKFSTTVLCSKIICINLSFINSGFSSGSLSRDGAKPRRNFSMKKVPVPPQMAPPGVALSSSSSFLQDYTVLKLDTTLSYFVDVQVYSDLYTPTGGRAAAEDEGAESETDEAAGASDGVDLSSVSSPFVSVKKDMAR